MFNNIYIIGAGLFGSVLAERITSILKTPVIVIEKRDHIGGNCYTFADKATGIICHKYGSHIFHTSNINIYKYISQFVSFNNYKHHVMAKSSDNRVFQWPINLDTINKFFNKNFSPTEAKAFVSSLIRKDFVQNPKNLRDQAINLVGSDLYKAFIEGYTKKQWNKNPELLPAYIIKRIPFRYNYNSDYFNDSFQGIPYNGYSALFDKLLENCLIKIYLNTSYNDIKDEITDKDLIIYSGPIDEFFNYKYGPLEWRSLDFEWETYDVSDYQGIAVLNESSLNIKYTRTHEYKHYHPEVQSDMQKTVICKEYSKTWSKDDIPYYPVTTTKNLFLYNKYYSLSLKKPNVFLGGRLGSYKYMDMDQVISQALNLFDRLYNII